MKTSKVHIGTMGWSYNFWTGNFYPAGLDPEEFLTEYSKHFETVEVDSTFYRIPTENTVAKWRDQTPSTFVFSLKFPKVITHEKMLRDSEESVEYFLKRITQLKPKLGPLLLQFPPTFKSENRQLLRDFLRSLPKGHRFAVEVRNKEFLDDAFYSVLRENNVALALVDQPLMPTLQIVTADFTYIRWEGDRKKVKGTLGRVEVNRENDIKTWAQQINRFMDSSVETFGYFSKYYSGHPPTDAKQLQKMFIFS